MGQAESKIVETGDMTKIREIERTGGAAAVYAYFKDKLDKWETEPVQLAITGRSASGKSTFINKIRGVKPTDKDFAKQGSGDTTTQKRKYIHPKYKNIHFWDLPGMGTMRVPVETYVANMEFSKFDFFFIFFHDVINQNDMIIAKEIIKQDKQFCFIRSKLDSDYDNCEVDGVTKENKIAEIRTKAEELIEKDDVLCNSSKIFYISGKKPEIGEMDLVNEYINSWLSEVKREAFVNALACVSDKIIEEKYKQLKSRMYMVTALAASISALPLPGMDMKINLNILVNEVKHYIEVFGISIEELGYIHSEKKIKLKCEALLVPQDKRTAVIIQLLQEALRFGLLLAVDSAAERLFPLLGHLISATATAIPVYRCLGSQLDNFHKDAIAVYDYIKNEGKAISTDK